MFDSQLYAGFDATFIRTNTESEKWDDRAAFGNANALPMWVADMDFQTVPAVIEGLKNRVEHGAFGYNIATPADKQALIGWLKRRHALEIGESDIIFSPGVVDSIYHCLRALLKPNSRVVIQPPVYGPFFSFPEKAGMQVIQNPLIQGENGWQMDFEGLEEILKAGADAIVICSPHNPVGRIWTKQELSKLAKLCAKYNTRIIADEIHADFEIEGKHTCILSIPEAQNAVQLVSATKTFNLAALRHSAIICKDEAARNAIADEMSFAMADVNLFGKLATRIAYNTGDDWLDTLLTYLKENRDIMYKALNDTGRLKPSHIEGTYLMWVDCRELNMSNKQLMEFFTQKAEIIPSEGAFFGTQGEGFIRLNIATQKSNIYKAMDQINKALKQL